MLKNTVRMGSDYDDIDGKESNHIWIHPSGKIYIRKSFQYSIPGWKIDEKDRIIDYWYKEWFRLLPAIDLFLKNNSWDSCNSGGCSTGGCGNCHQ